MEATASRPAEASEAAQPAADAPQLPAETGAEAPAPADVGSAAAAGGQAEATGGGGGGGGGGAVAPSRNDSIIIHPYLWPAAPLKAPLKLKKGIKQQLASLAVSSGGEGGAFVAELQAARDAFATALESTAVGDAAVTDSAAKYASLLLGLVKGSAASNGAAAAAAAAEADLDAELAAAEAGAGAGGSPLAPASPLRYAVEWAWSEGALFAPAPGTQPRKAVSSDAAFELASTLVGLAVRLAHAAALAVQDSASGVATLASTRAYALGRQAAGVLQYVAAQLAAALPSGLSADCDVHALQGFATLLLADAQSLTILRAVAKCNGPQLVSGIAADTASLYQRACSQVCAASVPGADGTKMAAYCRYKEAYCLAYAHAFNGISLWKQQDQCGAALKSLEAAAASLAAAKRAASGYDAAPPATLNLHHRRVDEELERLVADTQRRCQRENDAVFQQRPPTDTPPLPAGKRLAAAVPYSLPAAAAAVQGGVVDRCFGAGPGPPPPPMRAPGVVAMSAGGKAAGPAMAADGAVTAGDTTGGAGDKQEQGCSCWRWTVYLLTAPLLLALWLVGAVLSVLLLPVKLCCPCCGLPLGWAASLVLWLLAAPARGLRWASGSPFDDQKEGAKSGGKAGDGKAGDGETSGGGGGGGVKKK